jgi:uncharacterized protein YceH (UPF0502 family)
MIELTTNEARALGVLIEKATTTPEQYPLSLNALTSGCNQKNNRDPVTNLSDDDVFVAVEGLRAKQLAVRVDAAGSRVHKHRHEAERVLNCKGAELAILAELLVRGPQTLGELRGRASRMHPINTLDEAKAALQSLMTRDQPLVKQIAPSPGSRAERYVQLLSPQSQPATISQSIGTFPAETLPPITSGLSDRVLALEHDVAALQSALRKLAAAVGEPDPILAEPEAQRE